ncbi:DMT family transporter [Segnochrobactraceae bacterium EtOH-i3]
MSALARFAPFLYMNGSVAAFSTMDALVKGITGVYPTWQIVAIRFLVSFVLLGPPVLFTLRHIPRGPVLAGNALRGLCTMISAAAFFQALNYVALPFATSVFFTGPLMTAGLARLMIGEKAGGKLVGAIIAGFLGVLIIMSGELFGNASGLLEAEAAIGMALALLSAFAYAVSVVLIRVHAGEESALVSGFQQILVASIVATPLAASGWTPPAGGDIWWLLTIGVLGTIGTVSVYAAFSRAPAARLAPMEYLSFGWACLWSFLLYDELPSLTTIAGGVVIVAAALVATRDAGGGDGGAPDLLLPEDELDADPAMPLGASSAREA